MNEILIRKAISADLPIIKNWLDIADQTGADTFLCNWNLTKNVFKDNELIVAVNNIDEPIAYLWSDFGILEVKYDLRGQGIGEALAKFGLLKAEKNSEFGIQIECTPLTSVSFWQKLGFTTYTRNEFNIFAYYTILAENKIPISKSSSESALLVEIFPESKMWKPDSPCLVSATAKCTKVGDFYILNRSFCLFLESPQMVNLNDVIQITVNGELLYSNKIKYSEAGILGVHHKNDFLNISKIRITKPSTRCL